MQYRLTSIDKIGMSPVGFQSLGYLGDDDKFYTPLITNDAHHLTFLPTESFASLDLSLTGTIAEIGEPAQFGVRMPEGNVIVGNQRQLTGFLRHRIKMFAEWPIEHLTIAQFIGDQTVVAQASDMFFTHFKIRPNDNFAVSQLQYAIDNFNYNMSSSFDDIVYRQELFEIVMKYRGRIFDLLDVLRSTSGAEVPVPPSSRFQTWKYFEVDAEIDILDGLFRETFYLLVFRDDYTGIKIVDSCSLNSVSQMGYQAYGAWQRLTATLNYTSDWIFY